MRKQNLITAFLAVGLLGLASCLPLKVKDNKNAIVASNGVATPSQSVSPGGVSSVAAFQSTVYPIVTAHCNSCHVSTNQPFFATANVQADHDALVTSGKINLDNPALSRLVQRLSQDGHNCWSVCAQNATEMQNAIANWKTMLTPVATSTATSTTTTTGSTTATMTAVTPPPRMNTIEVLIPATLPGPGEQAANFTTLQFPLANATDTITPDVNGATFTIEIQKFDGFSYRIRNPKIISPTTAVYISDIRFSVNGVIRANDTTYSLVDQIVAQNNGGIALSPASLVTLMDQGVGKDKIAVSFASVKSSAAAGCKNLTGWTTSVKSVMTTSCVRCHNAGNSFDMVTGSDANICARTLGRVDLNVPANSPLITKPFTGKNHDGGGNLINQTTVNNWVNWITSER